MATDNNPKEKSTAAASGGFLGKLKNLSKLDLQEVLKADKLKKIFSSGQRKPHPVEENLKVLEMDLIKDEVVVNFDWREHFSSMFLFLLLAAVLIGEAYYALYIWGNNQDNTKSLYLKDEIAQTQKQIDDLKYLSNEAFSFKTKLTAVQPVFKRHIYWSNFFNFLQDTTLKDVYYLNFSGTTAGSYTLASKVKDYRAINVQLKAMLSNINTASASIANEKIDNPASSSPRLINPNTQPGASFDLNLKVKPDLFSK